MYQAIQTTFAISLLITCNECRPSERAETPGTSPFDFIADFKEGIAYNLIQRRIIDSVHMFRVFEHTTLPVSEVQSPIFWCICSSHTKVYFGAAHGSNGIFRVYSMRVPKPIVDTITEEEKYGNNGEHPIGRAVLKGVEGVSNLVNSAFEASKEPSRQVTYKITQFLDTLGGKLVGLQ